MNRWQKLIRCLALPGCERETADWWAAQLGEDPSAFEDLIVGTRHLSDSFRCGHSHPMGCRRAVEKCDDEVFFASCEHVPSECPPLKLGRDDVLIHKASLPGICRLLRDLFGLVEPSTAAATQGLLHVGDAHFRPDMRVPVFLIHGQRCDSPAWSLSSIDSAKHAALLVPTTEVASRVPPYGELLVFTLEPVVDIDRRGQPCLGDLGKARWEAWEKEICPREIGGVARIQTPADATWSHVTLGFGADNHTLSFHIETPTDQCSGALHIGRLGMMKKGGRPTDSWALLSKFFRGSGWHYSQGKTYQEEMKMPMKRLRETLSKLFGIKEPAIGWDRSNSAWVAAFQVRSDRT